MSSDVRHIKSDGERVVWVTRTFLSFHLEDLHDNHLLNIYSTQMRRHPDEPISDYVWAEIVFRGLENEIV
tara:strand:+ start:34 stop:243 length:210 start_codon:yes stop_codon:yes gene_type:complete